LPTRLHFTLRIYHVYILHRLHIYLTPLSHAFTFTAFTYTTHVALFIHIAHRGLPTLRTYGFARPLALPHTMPAFDTLPCTLAVYASFAFTPFTCRIHLRSALHTHLHAHLHGLPCHTLAHARTFTPFYLSSRLHATFYTACLERTTRVLRLRYVTFYPLRVLHTSRCVALHHTARFRAHVYAFHHAVLRLYAVGCILIL